MTKAWVRPCKGKRARYNKLESKLKKMIDEDPDTFDLDTIDLPQSIFFCIMLREKLAATLNVYRASILKKRLHDRN